MAAESRMNEPDQDDDVVLDVAALYAEGLRLLPDLWRQAEMQGRDPTGLALDLRDSAGKLLLCIPFSDLSVANRH